MSVQDMIGKLQREVQEEIYALLNAQSPPEAQGKWRQRGEGIYIDKILFPDAHEAVDIRESGGFDTVTEEVVEPSFVSRLIPKRIRSYRRRGKTGGVEQVRQHTRQQEQPTLDEQLTPVEKEKQVMVFKNPFIDDVIDTAVENVMRRNRRM